MNRLQSEIDRSSRTGRSFAVLFLDVDGLKLVNDRHGHLVGSRALCLVADKLRQACRAVDTPARYGGDEFAVVLPEADEEAAWRVGRRAQTLLAQDGQMPRISVSLGVGVYPRDGHTAEALLGAADRALYVIRNSNVAPGEVAGAGTAGRV